MVNPITLREKIYIHTYIHTYMHVKAYHSGLRDKVKENAAVLTPVNQDHLEFITIYSGVA